MRSLSANIQYLYLIKLSKWLMLIMPVVVLFYHDNGLDTYQVYLLQDIAAYSVLRLTSAARPLLRGEQRLELARPRFKAAAGKPAPKGAAGQGPYDEGLFEALRALRKRLAAQQGVPPYIVFGDATLVQMARDKPMDQAALLRVSGVGQTKLDRYGGAFLDLISSHCLAERAAVREQQPLPL